MSLKIDFKHFSSLYNEGRPQVISSYLVADLETPVSVFLKLADERKNAFLLESVEGGDVRGRYSIIGLKPDLIWRCKGNTVEVNKDAINDENNFEKSIKNPLQSLKDLLSESQIKIPEGLPPMSAGLVGYIGYDMVRQMEKLPHSNPDILDLPDSILLRPTIMAIFDSVKDTISLVATVWPNIKLNALEAYDQALTRLSETVKDLEKPLPIPIPNYDKNKNLKFGRPVSNTSLEEYREMVEAAKKYIFSGDVFQVVPSQRFEVNFPLPSFALYRSLRRLNPSPFLYYLNFGDFSVVGSSPEILVRLREDKVTIRPIAGTRPRGSNRSEDDALAKDLLSDSKELAEHLMLLDLGRNDVGRVAKTGSVKVTDEMIIEHYSHVMHIVSNVEGSLREGLDSVDALIAGFPAGTVTGAPKVRAMEIIDELEKTKRGIYAGAVGYFSAGGSMDTCIALRTAVIKNNIMYVQAGGGVVADSDPELEYEETVNKARALFRAAEDAVRFALEGRS
ncbi:MAG: anthranilate synthase component I [Rhodospirillaceae bacterium]|nr:anthranilate synthase component I [Rhodospirillaceae bacterium]|tara:strand:- start:3279 stop:4796 length:1518 start_codon:yes stop_codon:yes gene_type:complete